MQFLKFGVVGGVGFVIDTASVYGLRTTFGIYGAGLTAYIIAATGTWLMNRIWTFRGCGSASVLRQWAAFMAANFLGFLLNRGTFVLLVATVPMIARQPVVAVAAGSLAGLGVNFNLSRRLVFR